MVSEDTGEAVGLYVSIESAETGVDLTSARDHPWISSAMRMRSTCLFFVIQAYYDTIGANISLTHYYQYNN